MYFASEIYFRSYDWQEIFLFQKNEYLQHIFMEKTFLCSTQLSMKFFMLINLRLVKIANSFLINIAEHENFSANKYENAIY